MPPLTRPIPFIIIQVILTQIRRVYEEIDFYRGSGSAKKIPAIYLNIGFGGAVNILYDFLIFEGHKIDFPEPDKEEIWKESRKQLATHTHKKNWSKEMLKEERVKVYKSMLAKKYLIDRYIETGEKIQLLDDNGKPIKELTIVAQ